MGRVDCRSSPRTRARRGCEVITGQGRALPACGRMLRVFALRPQNMEGWVPCKESARSLQRRWAEWQPITAADALAALMGAAKEELRRCIAAPPCGLGRAAMGPLVPTRGELRLACRELRAVQLDATARSHRVRIGRAIWRL